MAQGFQPAQLRIEHHVLGQITEHLPHARVAGRSAEDTHLPLAGPQQTEDQLHGGGLARTVMPEQAEHFALGQIQVQPAQHGDIAIVLADAFDLDDVQDASSWALLRGGGWTGVSISG